MLREHILKLATLKNIKHKQQVIYRMDTFVSPTLGKMPIDSIKRADLVRVVCTIQDGGIIETAHRVGTHIEMIDKLFAFFVIGDLECQRLVPDEPTGTGDTTHGALFFAVWLNPKFVGLQAFHALNL